MQRRQFLGNALLAGGGLAFAGSGLAGWRAHRAGLLLADDAPFAPWDVMGALSPGDPTGMAAAAILASNPHNTQPWRIALSDMASSTGTGGALMIRADTARHLGSFDPYRREMWIGLGAAIANAEITAPGLGFAPGQPVIRHAGHGGAGTVVLPLRPATPRMHALAPFIAERRTNRAAYDARALPGNVLADVLRQTGQVPGASLVLMPRASRAGAAFARDTLAGTEAIIADRVMSADSHHWFRANAREVARHRDGVSVPTAGLAPALAVAGQLLPEADAKTSGDYWLASTRTQLSETAGFGLITVDDLDDRVGQLAAGRLWQRFHLALTAAGLAAQPMNQLPELVDRDRQLGIDRGWAKRMHAITRAAGNQPGKATFAFRYGVPMRQVPHSARRPLDWVML